MQVLAHAFAKRLVHMERMPGDFSGCTSLKRYMLLSFDNSIMKILTPVIDRTIPDYRS